MDVSVLARKLARTEYSNDSQSVKIEARKQYFRFYCAEEMSAYKYCKITFKN